MSKGQQYLIASGVFAILHQLCEVMSVDTLAALLWWIFTLFAGLWHTAKDIYQAYQRARKS